MSNREIIELANIIAERPCDSEDCAPCIRMGRRCNDYLKAERAIKAGYRKQRVGEWVVTYKHGFWHYDCPFCGDGYAQEGKLPISNYCSNCGAKMKGGAE